MHLEIIDIFGQYFFFQLYIHLYSHKLQLQKQEIMTYDYCISLNDRY